MKLTNIFKNLTGYFSLLALVAAPAGPVIAQPSSTAQVASPPVAFNQRSAADLEKLAAPIALYPDPLIAVLLPASTHVGDLVQAARFVANPRNSVQLDSQPWDAD